MLLLLIAGCQEPFGADRHDLLGFRIAAVSIPAADVGETIQPRAAVIVDGHAWAGSPADLAWTWVQATPEAVEAVDPLTPADGLGPAPELVVEDDDQRRLVLVARIGKEETRAFADVPRRPASSVAFTGVTLDPATGAAAPGGEVLVTANVTSDDGGTLTRWMSTDGTWIEQDRLSAAWSATADDLHLGAGTHTWLTLVLGADGRTAFRAGEIHVGPPGPGLWTDGRWVPTDAPVVWSVGEVVRGTLVADERSPIGVTLTGGVAEPITDVTDWGTPALPCLVGADGPLDPAWFLTQRCGTSGADGIEVVVFPELAP